MLKYILLISSITLPFLSNKTEGSFLPKYEHKLHPFYSSITKIEYNEKLRETELSIKVFQDDMEKALTTQHPSIKSFELNTPKENNQTNTFINDYFLKSIAIKINNKSCKIKFIGKEYDNGDVLWCYFSIENKKPFKTVELTNTIFTELYAKQSNIVQITQQKIRKNLLLTKDETSGKVSF